MKQSKSGWSVNGYYFPATLIIILSLTAFNDKTSVLDDKGNPYQSVNPYGWFLSGNQPDQYRTGIDNQVARHGKQSAIIECVTEKPTGFSTLMQSCFTKDIAGKRVRMTGYIKSEDASTATMWARVDDYINKVTADFDNMYDRQLSGTNDWTKCEIIFDVTSRCSVLYGFILSGTGKIWVDNVTLEVVDDSIIKTAEPADTPLPEGYLKQIETMPRELPERPPVNLDFEN